MAGDSLGSLVVKISGDLSELRSDMDKAAYLAEQAFKRIDKAGQVLANGLKGIAAGLVTGLSVSAIKNFVDETVAATAALQQMAEKTGATVESLSALRSVAKLSGTDMGSVEAAVTKMAKGMTGAQDQTKGFGGALAYLGLSAKDAQGNLKQTDELFLDIAKSLDNYADGAGKTALAQALFGKSGAAMIPVLKDLAIAGEYNAKVTTAQAEAADEYEKNLKRLSAMKSAISKQIVIEMIPAMNDLVVVFLRAQKESDGFRAQLAGLVKDGTIRTWAEDVAMFIARGMDVFRTSIIEIKVAYADLLVVASKVNLELARQATLGTKNPITDYFAKQLQDNQAYVSALEAQAKKADKYYQTMLGQQQAGRREGENVGLIDSINSALGGGRKPQANPNLADSTVRDFQNQLIALQAALAATQKAMIDAGHAIFKGALDLELSDLKASYDLRLIAARDYFDQDTALRLEQATANRDRLAKEVQDQIATIAKSVALASQIRGKDADDQRRKEAEAAIKIEGERQKLIALLGDEAKAEQALAAVRADGATRTLLYYQQIQDAVRSIRLATDDYVRALQDQIDAAQLNLDLIGKTEQQQGEARIAAERALKLRDLELQYERQLYDLRLKQADPAMIAAVIEQYAIEKDAVNSLYAQKLKLYDLTADRVKLQELSNSLTDALLNAFESGKSGVTAFIDWLKAEFAKTVLRPVIQTAVNAGLGAFGLGAAGSANASIGGPLFGGIFDSISSFFSGSSGAGAGWGMNDRSLGDNTLPGLFEKYFGQGGNVSTALGGIVVGLGVGGAIAQALGHGDTHHDGAAVGAIIGTIVDLYYGGSGMVGGAAGGAVGGIFDSFNDGDAMRTARIGQGPGDYTYASTGSQFGDIGIKRFSDEHFSDADMGQTLRGWFQAIGKLDAEVARHFSATEISNAAALLATRDPFRLEFGIEHTALDPEAMSTMIRQRYGVIFSTIDQQMADLISGFKGSGEDLINLVIDLATVHERLSGLHAEFATLFGQEFSFADLAAVKGETESYTEALARLAGEFSVTNQIAEMLGKTQEEVWGSIGLASEGARAKLIDLAGGLDKLGEQLDYYYTHFYTTAEQQAHTLSTLQQSFSDVGVAMPMTVDGFRQITDGFLAMGPAGAQAAATMLALAPTFYQYIGAIESVNDALTKNQLGFRAIFGQSSNVGVEDIKGFQQNGEVLTATLTRLTGEFNATNNLLVMFGMTSEQVFGAFGLASEAARAKLIELSGGLDTFTANLSGFYQNYFSEQERAQQSMEHVQGVFADLGLTMPTTLQGFRELVQHELSLGPAGAAAAAALLAVQQQFFDLITPLDKAGKEVADFVAAVATAAKTETGLRSELFELTHSDAEITARNRALRMEELALQERAANLMPGTLTALQAQIDAQIDLNATADAARKAHQALIDLNETLMNSFKDAARSIQLAGLTNEEQYRFLQREAAGMVGNLTSATSGEDVQMWAEKIKADMLAAFNLLGTDEQNARRQEFLDNLLRVQEMAANRLAALDPSGTLTQQQTTPAAAAAEAQTAAAHVNQESAALNRQAAEMQIEAAQAQLLASQVPKRVQIDFPQQGVTMEAGA